MNTPPLGTALRRTLCLAGTGSGRRQCQSPIRLLPQTQLQPVSHPSDGAPAPAKAVGVTGLDPRCGNWQRQLPRHCLTVLGITFALAPVTYRWVEVPGIRHRSPLIRGRLNAPARD
jgi:hypothetical protein